MYGQITHKRSYYFKLQLLAEIMSHQRVIRSIVVLCTDKSYAVITFKSHRKALRIALKYLNSFDSLLSIAITVNLMT